MCFTLLMPCRNIAFAAKKTAPDYHGTSTYYSNESWEFDKKNTTLLTEYYKKKVGNFYKCLVYYGDWVKNQGQIYSITTAATKERSVTKIVSTELGVSASDDINELSAKLSSSYSTTVTYTFSVSQTNTYDLSKFVSGDYRLAGMGTLYGWDFKKVNTVTKNTSFTKTSYCYSGNGITTTLVTR
ncbi:hypothetical protein [[Clostridium] polysaccharolyticum]|uniref:Uncharacterized protein n=1 Tax=[Clostridium] polysaccharolyticum TaxID=29364 RepID=A0A1I0D3X1_9FIRM|nr:hypothetical protein [[Clostridium] polysaccharolyticum]SET26287.1 hypothetical protein SAMN04487772_11285 [[Clostridium] polysaccharolyticum]